MDVYCDSDVLHLVRVSLWRQLAGALRQVIVAFRGVLRSVFDILIIQRAPCGVCLPSAGICDILGAVAGP